MFHEDHGVGFGAGRHRSRARENGPSDLRVERSEPEPSSGVVAEDPAHGGVAQGAEAVEQDDGGGRGRGRHGGNLATPSPFPLAD